MTTDPSMPAAFEQSASPGLPIAANWGYSPKPDSVSPQRLEPAPTAPARIPPDTDPLAGRLAFNIKETADMLGVSEKTVRRLIARRLLHPSRALRHLLIPKAEIERFLNMT